jgi:DNA polymerase I-like protein with 3'-5' exonuclease and polymerase domains
MTKIKMNSRFALQAPPGYAWVSVDFSSQELRLAGAFSKDSAITEIYVLEDEYHRGIRPLPLSPEGLTYTDPKVDQHLVASTFLNKDIEWRMVNEPWTVSADDPVISPWRKKGKIMNFKVIYGGSASSLAADLNCDDKEAGRLLKQYFTGFHGLYTWIEITGSLCSRTRWVRSAMGRFINVNEDNAKGIAGKSTTRRKAVNSVIQSSGSEMLKISLPRVRQAIETINAGERRASIINATHDEINLLVPGYVAWQVDNSRVVPILDQDYYTGPQLDEFMLAQRYAAAALHQMESAGNYILKDVLGSDIPCRAKPNIHRYWSH